MVGFGSLEVDGKGISEDLVIRFVVWMQYHQLRGFAECVEEGGVAGGKDLGFELHLQLLVEVGVGCFG